MFYIIKKNVGFFLKVLKIVCCEHTTMQIRAILMLTLRTLFNNYQHIFKSAVKMVVFDLSKNRPLMCASTPKTSSTLDKTPEQQLRQLIGLSKPLGPAEGS